MVHLDGPRSPKSMPSYLRRPGHTWFLRLKWPNRKVACRLPRLVPRPDLGASMMVDELTRYEFEVLSDDGNLALFRGRSCDGRPSILVRCPSSNSSATTVQERLSREFSLATELDDEWAAR